MSGLMKLGGGPKATTTNTLLLRLLECHDRIRRFLVIAERLALTTEAAEDDRQLAGRSLVRYFSHALPLHVADEEASIAPRLGAKHDAARIALFAMTNEHHAMEPILVSLIDAWQRIADDAADTTTREGTLAQVVALREVMLPHLAAEERDVFPLLAELTPEEQAAIVAEMETRRVGA